MESNHPNDDIEKQTKEIVYLKKPLKIKLPLADKDQSIKNPFAQSFKRSMTKQKESNFTPQLLSPRMNSVSLPRTSSTERRATATLEKVAKPSLFNSEPVEEDESSIKEEGKKSLSENSPMYKIDMTQEVISNFDEIEKIKFISIDEVNKKSVDLPELKKKKLSDKMLLLDLDDTLAHTINDRFDYSSVDISYKEVRKTMYYDQIVSCMTLIKVIIRPYAIKFLEEISKYYEVVVVLYIT